MADISKIKLAGETEARNIKDAQARTDLATAQAGLAQEILDRQAADTNLQTNITAEETRAKGVEGGLNTRISNLEARGRFLSKFDVETGHPTTDPTIPSEATSPYTYTFKTGDYYIVGNVPSTGKKYMPSGANIIATKSGDTWSWNYDDRRAETEATISTGDQFVYDGASWTHIAAAKDIAWGNITGTLSEQTDLQSALDAKVATTTKVGSQALSGDVTVDGLKTDLGLKDMAYTATASGSYTPAGSVTVDSYTPAGTIALGELTQTATAATLTKAAYTPAGSITGSAISGGSITVTVKDAASASEATLSRADYTPAGSIVGDAIKGGSISVTIKDASTATAVTDITYETYQPAGSVALTASDSGTWQVGGTVSAPSITVDDSAKDTFVKSLKAGATAAASFTEGAFTPAEIQSGFYTAGSDASLSEGAQASLTAQTKSAFATQGIVAAVDKTDTEMLVFTAASTSDAVTDRGTFTANTLQTLTGGKATVIDTTKFSGGSKVADTFTAEKLPVVDGTASAVTGVKATASAPTFTGAKYNPSFTGTSADIKFSGAKYLKQEIDDASFSGTAASLTFTGTKETGLKVTKAEYAKQEIDTATFTGTTATLGFSGTEVADFQVTGVSYSKATANGATFTGTSATINATFSGTAATITVSPNA